MARQINYEKLDAVKYSTMKLIAENGSQGATISEVAKHAGVSAGYLYTHFESKDALVDQLITDIYGEILKKLIVIGKQEGTIKDKLATFIRSFMRLADEDPVRARFLISLAHDERFLKEFILEDPHGVFEIAEKVLVMGKTEGFFREDLIVQELLLIMLNLPISCMYYGFMVGPTEIKADMSNRIVTLCLSALR
ncbi:MAG: TetR/AcrR family transcriptional regulator [Clostridia bacterium]|nr:TetR/AcrR family transcriptional regulator [Clostridia bacterium]